MALKDLLVCIDPTTGSDTRLKLAFNLARTNKAHLAGAYSLPDAQAVFGGATRFGGFPGMSGVAGEPISPGSAVSEATTPRSPTGPNIASRTSNGSPALMANGTPCLTATRPS